MAKQRTPYATLVALAVVGVYYFLNGGQNVGTGAAPSFVDSANPIPRVEQPRAGAMFESSGVVDRVLSDDNKGSRHQRFILKLQNGKTLLVAHNIDLAPRVANIKVGDTVKFRGQYETNDRGGVIHWTHHDPRGNHEEGWLEHEGKRYQ